MEMHNNKDSNATMVFLLIIQLVFLLKISIFNFLFLYLHKI